MIDQPLTVPEFISELRDGLFIVGMMVFGWKARSWFQPIKEFFSRVNHHMDVVEHGMKVILENHLTHIEADLKTISGRKNSYLDVNESPVTKSFESYDKSQEQ